MITGRPAQSLVLRVAVTGAPTRCEGIQSVVISELGWPPPGLSMMKGSGHDPDNRDHFKTHSRWLRSVRITRDTLYGVWGAVPRQPTMFWSHRMEPLGFLSWLSPSTFAVGSREMSLVIARRAEGEYAFGETFGDTMIEPLAE